MKLRNFLKISTYKLFLANFGVACFQHLKTFTVIGPVETIDYILNHHVSISRYGDGELNIILGRGNGFQQYDRNLAIRLKEIINSQMDGHTVCLPYPFESLDNLTTEAYGFWRGHIGLHALSLLRVIPKNHSFFDTNFTRFYISFEDRSISHVLINKIKQLWDGRDVYIIEGVGTRMGIGNDLLDNARSIKRIIGPSTNAFEKYSDIFSSIKSNVPKDSLILCALGMTATVLAYDLCKEGYWAIDIGHLDIEYEWYKNQAKEKTAIKDKSVNEVGINLDNDIDNREYQQQIICRV